MTLATTETTQITPIHESQAKMEGRAAKVHGTLKQALTSKELSDFEAFAEAVDEYRSFFTSTYISSFNNKQRVIAESIPSLQLAAQVLLNNERILRDSFKVRHSIYEAFKFILKYSAPETDFARTAIRTLLNTLYPLELELEKTNSAENILNTIIKYAPTPFKESAWQQIVWKLAPKQIEQSQQTDDKSIAEQKLHQANKNLTDLFQEIDVGHELEVEILDVIEQQLIPAMTNLDNPESAKNALMFLIKYADTEDRIKRTLNPLRQDVYPKYSKSFPHSAHTLLEKIYQCELKLVDKSNHPALTQKYVSDLLELSDNLVASQHHSIAIDALKIAVDSAQESQKHTALGKWADILPHLRPDDTALWNSWDILEQTKDAPLRTKVVSNLLKEDGIIDQLRGWTTPNGCKVATNALLEVLKYAPEFKKDIIAKLVDLYTKPEIIARHKEGYAELFPWKEIKKLGEACLPRHITSIADLATKIEEAIPEKAPEPPKTVSAENARAITAKLLENLQQAVRG